MKNSLFGKAALFAAVGVLSAGTALAQTMTQGGIAGTVEDATGAAIPGAAILIHNNGNGNDTNLKSGASGEYTAPLLPPGTYIVTFAAAGFSTEKATVTVLVNQLTDVNPHLKTGEASQTVEVSSDVPTIQLDSPAFGGHLENREIENIPINNRRWSSLALTTPGVTNTQDGFGLLSFRGIPGVLNNVQIDGVDDNQAFFSEERGRTRAGYSTSQAAVREFQVNTGVYSAELGRAVGGVVNSVTKTGGNQMHGEVYFYHRNDETSSENPKVTLPNPVAGGQPLPFRPKDKRNQYGFAAGGALIKDKLFWFYAFDVFARQFPGTAVSGAPIPLAQTCTPPTTVGGVTTGNANYAALIAATGATPTQCAAALAALQSDLGIVPRFGDQEINTPKLTWQINPKNTLDVYYHRLRWDSPGGVQTQAAVSYAVDSFGTDFVKLDYGVGKLNSLITSHLTNELRYQYARELNDEGQQPFSAYTTNHLIGNGGMNATYASIATASGGFNLGSPYYSYRVAYPDERKWQIGDTAAYIYKKHTIRFGVDFVHNYDLQNNVYQSNGSYSYATVSSYLADILKPSGACLAQTSTGTPAFSATGTANCYSSESQGFGPSIFDLSTLDTAYFVQDDWKVAPNFTLNLGVRYDYEALPAPYANAVSTFAPQEANHPSDKNNISPRIGFAWDPFGNGKTSVRGGFGIYYGRIPNAVLLNAFVNTGTANGQASYTTYNGSTYAAGIIPGGTTLKFPNVLNSRPTSGGLLSAQYLDAHMQNPYTEQFDLSIQREIGRGNVLSLSYLGALGKELPNYINTNINPAGSYNVTYTLVAANGSTTCAGHPCGTTFTQKVYNNVTLNTNFLNITDAVSNANSSYSGFVVEVQNRTSKLLSYDVNYTWSHSLDYNVVSTTANGTNNFIDPYDPTSSYGNSLIDVPNRLVGWAIFNMPGIKAHNALSYATNGWSFKPLLQVQTGLPYSISLSSGSPNGQTTGTGPTAVVQKPISSGISGTGVTTFIPFFGRNNYFAPANIALDARLQKDFRLHGDYELQVFAEGFNLLNHQNITAVNTGAYSIANPTDPITHAAINNGTSQLQTSQPNFFGVASSSGVNGTYAYQVRQFQFGARVTF
jgi:hypothetical protein